MSSAGKMDAVSQMPVVLLPIHFDRFNSLDEIILEISKFDCILWVIYLLGIENICFQIPAGESAVML